MTEGRLSAERGPENNHLFVWREIGRNQEIRVCKGYFSNFDHGHCKRRLIYKENPVLRRMDLQEEF